MFIGYEPYLHMVNLYIDMVIFLLLVFYLNFCMNIYVRSVGCLLCQSWCWWCQGFTKWLVMCFSFLCVLEWFVWNYLYIYALRGYWIHLWKSQAHNEPFGGGQWEPLGLDSVEAEPETRIHMKEFLRECPQEKWRGMWEGS